MSTKDLVLEKIEQHAKQKSIWFSEWCNWNGWIMVNKKKHQWWKEHSPDKTKKTTEELYAQFELERSRVAQK